MSSMFELETLEGETVVYPGHPITVGYLIMKRYPSLEEALAPTENQVPHALGNIDIPGGGGRVYAALNLLRRRAEGESWESLFAWADHIWELEHFHDHEKGLEQAEAIKELIKAATWGQTK